METFEVSPTILKTWTDELPQARKNLAILGATVNLAVAGTLLKTELKAATGELKAETAVDVTNGRFAQPNHSNDFSTLGQKQ